jgi:hypothetical protein
METALYFHYMPVYQRRDCIFQSHVRRRFSIGNAACLQHFLHLQFAVLGRHRKIRLGPRNYPLR